MVVAGYAVVKGSLAEFFRRSEYLWSSLSLLPRVLCGEKEGRNCAHFALAVCAVVSTTRQKSHYTLAQTPTMAREDSSGSGKAT